jgi:hypothetical protein
VFTVLLVQARERVVRTAFIDARREVAERLVAECSGV